MTSTSTCAGRRRWSTRSAITSQQGVAPLNFYYEKFTGTGLVTETGEEHLTVVASDEAFDAKLALELGAASLVLGRLDRRPACRISPLAEATGPYIKDGQFTDVDAFRRTNAAFHAFLIESTGNATLHDAYNRLSIQEFMAEALRPRLAASQKITQDHLDLVALLRADDLETAQRILIEHTERSKETMRAGIQQAAGHDWPPGGRHDPPRSLRRQGRRRHRRRAGNRVYSAANLAREGGKVALVDRSELIHEVREKLVYELRDKLPREAPRSWRSSPTSSATPTAARS